MTVSVDLTKTQLSTVLPYNTWVTLFTGSAAAGNGIETITSATVTPTPSTTAQIRVRSRGLATTTTAVTVTTLTAVRIGPFTIDNNNGDVVELQAKRTGTTGGGVQFIDQAMIQGSFTDQPGPGEGAETGISVHPNNVTVAPGDPATFTVSAVGTGLSYQWEENDGAWSNVGTDQNSYTVTSPVVGDSGNLYRVTVTGDNDPAGGPVTSNTATLTVATTTAAITTEPSDQTVAPGENATFTVLGTDITEWECYERSGGTGNGSVVSSGGPWSLPFASHVKVAPQLADDGNEFRFALRGTDGADVFSRWALLTVTAAAADQIILTDLEVT